MESRRPSSNGYRWTCPHCGESRLNTSEGKSGERNAITALRTHIAASAGAEHGPRNEFPRTEAISLAAHVERVVRGG